MTERLLVIGGDAAGMSAASRAKRRRPSLDVVAFERGEHTSFAACGIPYVLGGDIASTEELVARSPAEHAEHGIDVKMRTEAIELDTAGARVKVRELDTGTERWEAYDRLMVGTGASPLRPPIDGIDAPNVHGVQHLDAVPPLLEEAERSSGTNVVLIGAGYIGVELAEAFAKRGANVTMLEAGDQAILRLPADLAEDLRAGIENIGVQLKTNESVQAIGSDHVSTSEGAYPADLVVLGLGVRPNTSLAEDAGMKLGPAGGIVTDDRQQTSIEGVYAAGDCCVARHRISGELAYVPLGTTANRQGRVAGTNLGGGDARFPGILGTAVLKLCGVEIGMTGLNLAEALDAGFDAVANTITSSTTAGYYPTSEQVRVTMVAERGTGRLLGCFIVGGAGSAKRIDTAATALWNEMTAEALAEVDLSYAPPFSPVWDPISIAARQVAEAT
ncbi:MAG TPA: flavoprotein oxidoreductase [Candidatus Microthrix parvicella]|jgi:NADPH-dependent 2,4-dienoyl-CoA reductase/sulfur reductase-like enzyme|uniref:FAD-dependent oxidoreductase n=1 Tax=Candidatus Neomicrothrix sp. TaxID=2719034 RepID=UPI000E96D01F|nr:FAD-dependent oxidoreductase [Candidatus Microthrix sp.]MBP6135377.1 FAD-dependent oxidoreductase [Candidatus Microthrix sp.]MBP7986363.1 FAD-dependent oxidoreductase [Candidatus Microthrix sp.]HBX10328.1 flavoprotein oxidoreductase [Candidatus Microthrix parvicella]